MTIDIDTLIERELRSLDKLIKTNDLVARIAREDVPVSAVYKRLLALAPICPAASKDTAHSFVRYGRTCYPWMFRRLLDSEQLIQRQQEESRLHRADGMPPAVIHAIAKEVVALLSAGGYTLATIGPETAEPEACLLCNALGSWPNGLCAKCEEEL